MSWIMSYLLGDCNKPPQKKPPKKRRRPGSSDLRVKKSLILPLTHPRQCNGTSPPQLEIAHNQSTGRHISVLLKRINVKCRGQINGWQDSKSIDMDLLFDITSALATDPYLFPVPLSDGLSSVRPAGKNIHQWSKVCEGQHRWNGRGI